MHDRQAYFFGKMRHNGRKVRGDTMTSADIHRVPIEVRETDGTAPSHP